MDDLAERIKASIENRNADPWFPELTAHLAARAWGRLHRDIGLTHDSYGTERVLSHSVSAPREIITSLKTGLSTCSTAPAISIEALSQECAVQYEKQEATFYTPDEILHTTILSSIEEAIAIINQVPSLMRTVAVLVRSLHVIRPEDLDHDVSFSEPEVPFSVFVSVPKKRTENDALRVAEAIIHEAMHLQLTLIEETVALSVPSPREFFSPWRGKYRTAQGVLHGVYVFRVVDQFLRALSFIQKPSAGKLSYLTSRQEQIVVQMGMIRDFEDCSDLTKVGASLAKNLIWV